MVDLNKPSWNSNSTADFVGTCLVLLLFIFIVVAVIWAACVDEGEITEQEYQQVREMIVEEPSMRLFVEKYMADGKLVKREFRLIEKEKKTKDRFKFLFLEER